MIGHGSAAFARRTASAYLNSHTSSRLAIAILLAAGGLAAATPAAAQPAADPQPSANDQGLADIVVTAERRATNLQSTPLSIVAVTQDVVEAKGIQDLEDLSHFTPNLVVSPSRGSGAATANFVIRGISGGGGATGERGVGLYIDGIYMPRTSGAVLRVLDVDRVEVLRGPQGTLFGRNSTGGAIRIFSKQPTSHFEGSIEGTIGNFDHHDIIGMINVPLGEGFALRAQGAYLDKGGFVTRGTQKLGAEKDYVGRLQLRGEIAPGFTATAGFLYNKSEANATPWVVENFDLRPGIDGIIQGNYSGWLNDSFKAAGQAPIAAYNDPRVVRGKFHAPDLCYMDDFDPDYDPSCNQFNDDRYWQTDLTLNWKLSDNVSVNSITGYSDLKHSAATDWEQLGMEMRYEYLRSKVFYQELQINASLFDKIDVVAGGSYFHENSSAPYNYTVNRRGTSNYPSSPGTPANADGGLFTRTITDVYQKSDSWGLFGSATWHIVDGLNLTGGLRRAWDHKDYTQTRYPPPATAYQASDFTVAPGTTSTTVHNSAPFHALDYRATLDYHFTKDIMAYATVSKAYKAGSFSYTVVSYGPPLYLTGPDQTPLIIPLPNEKVINYEAGLRMTLFDRRLRLNPTVFEMHWTDRQATVRITCGTGQLSSLVPGGPGCPAGFIPMLQDQGNARIRGIELDGEFIVGGGLTIDGNLGISRSKLTNAPTTITHLFPDIPKLSYTVGANYSVNAGFGKATFNLNYAYVGKQWVYPSDEEDSTYRLPSYGLVNARIQFVPANFPVTFTVYANNLLDNTYATYAERFGGGFWDAGGPPTALSAPPRSMLSVVRGRSREVGFTAKWNF